MSEARTTKEAIYDEHISPLMAQIITLCKEHKINMIADFSLGPDPTCDDQPLYCTTALTKVDPSDTDGTARMNRGYDALKPRMHAFAMTIIKGDS